MIAHINRARELWVLNWISAALRQAKCLIDSVNSPATEVFSAGLALMLRDAERQIASLEERQ